MDVDFGEAGVKLLCEEIGGRMVEGGGDREYVSMDLEQSKKKKDNREKGLTRVYIVSYAVLRVSSPSSTLCDHGPICTVRINSLFTCVSRYSCGKKIFKCSRMSRGLLRAAELRADIATRRTV